MGATRESRLASGVAEKATEGFFSILQMGWEQNRQPHIGRQDARGIVAALRNHGKFVDSAVFFQ
jgi:hypothetical protein